MTSKYTFNFFFLLLTFCFSGRAQEPAFLRYLNDPWVEGKMKQMSTDEKIGQLFMVQVYPKAVVSAADMDAIVRHKVGGVLFMQGTPTQLVETGNRMQQAAGTPLLYAIDAEWGPGFRISNTMKYPVQLALGAMQSDSLIFQMGKEIGIQLKRLGIQMNMAPVADVNNNAANPVINYRSFGEEPATVAQKTLAYANGMQAAGVIAVGKHFPGHGDTETDSHHALPLIKHPGSRLDSVELFPFRKIIQGGIAAIMTAHLEVPAFDERPIPASLSEKIVQQKLKNELGFKGLVITDAMNMSGAGKASNSAEAAVLALKAGNDMLEVVPNLADAIAAVKKVVASGELPLLEVEAKCRKILALKKWGGLDNWQPVELKTLVPDLNKPQYELTKRLLHEQSLTLLRNENDLLPLQKLDTLKLAYVSLGERGSSSFTSMLGKFKKGDVFDLPENAALKEVDHLLRQLANYNLVICGVHGMNLGAANRFGTNQAVIDALSKIRQKKVVAFFGNPYALDYFKSIENTAALVLAYQDNRQTRELAAQLVFGAIGANGKLPVTVNRFFRMGDGISIKKNGRLKYTIPEEVGINSFLFENQVDLLANLGVGQHAYPGCQVLFAVDGKVILQKSYGSTVYEHPEDSVTNDHLYDIASVTKVAASAPALMKLYGEGKLDLNAPFSKYWPPFATTTKSRFSVKDALSHQAQLQPGIIFWTDSVARDGSLRPDVFRDSPTDAFSVRISNSLFMDSANLERMNDEIARSKMLRKKKYEYSDLPFILVPQIVEKVENKLFEDYLADHFYNPIGASTLLFRPFEHEPLEMIVPTEWDTRFRKELLHGFVHDESAAMRGGVSGNAGLFGSANDLAKVMQLFLQKGFYGGEQLVPARAVDEFVRVQFRENQNRRALVFDKPYLDNALRRPTDRYPCASASAQSFGHTGFTGTMVWADPHNGVLFVFLSNRVYPTRENSLLARLRIRADLLQAVYDHLPAK